MIPIIRVIRRSLDMTQRELAEIAGVSTSSIAQYEKNGRKISHQAAAKISEKLRAKGGIGNKETLLAVQWYQYCISRLSEVNDETKSPIEKVEVLQNMHGLLEKILYLDVLEEFKSFVIEKKREEVELALWNLAEWEEKEGLGKEEEGAQQITERVKKEIVV